MIKHIWEKIWDIIKKLTNKEILAYLIFGILTTAIDWLVYIGLEPTGLSESNRTLIAWIAAVIFAFITNKIFVFKSTNFKIKFILKVLLEILNDRKRKEDMRKAKEETAIRLYNRKNPIGICGA